MDHAKARRGWQNQAMQPIRSWHEAQAMPLSTPYLQHQLQQMGENAPKAKRNMDTYAFLKFNL